MQPLPAELHAARNTDRDIQNIHRKSCDISQCWRKSLKSRTQLSSVLQESLKIPTKVSKAAVLGTTKNTIRFQTFLFQINRMNKNEKKEALLLPHQMWWTWAKQDTKSFWFLLRSKRQQRQLLESTPHDKALLKKKPSHCTATWHLHQMTQFTASGHWAGNGSSFTINNFLQPHLLQSHVASSSSTTAVNYSRPSKVLAENSFNVDWKVLESTKIRLKG